MHSGRLVRNFVLLIAFSATLLLSMVAASPIHFHSDTVTNGCDICTIAHLPAIQPISAHHSAPPLLRDSTSEQTAQRPSDAFALPELSRGPPAPVAFD